MGNGQTMARQVTGNGQTMTRQVREMVRQWRDSFDVILWEIIRHIMLICPGKTNLNISLDFRVIF